MEKVEGLQRFVGVQLVMASVHNHTAVHKDMGSLPQIHCGFEDMATERYWIGTVGIHCLSETQQVEQSKWKEMQAIVEFQTPKVERTHENWQL